jgi:hypothetical protein
MLIAHPRCHLETERTLISLAVYQANDLFQTASVFAIMNAFLKANLTLLSNDSFSLTTQDFTPYASNWSVLRPDVVVGKYFSSSSTSSFIHIFLCS